MSAFTALVSDILDSHAIKALLLIVWEDVYNCPENTESLCAELEMENARMRWCCTQIGLPFHRDLGCMIPKVIQRLASKVQLLFCRWRPSTHQLAHTAVVANIERKDGCKTSHILKRYDATRYKMMHDVNDALMLQHREDDWALLANVSFDFNDDQIEQICDEVVHISKFALCGLPFLSSRGILRLWPETQLNSFEQAMKQARQHFANLDRPWNPGGLNHVFSELAPVEQKATRIEMRPAALREGIRLLAQCDVRLLHMIESRFL